MPEPIPFSAVLLIRNESAFARVTGELLHDGAQYGKIQSISMHMWSHSVYFFFLRQDHQIVVHPRSLTSHSRKLLQSLISKNLSRTWYQHGIHQLIHETRSLLCMAEQNASHINTSSTILNSPSATIHRLNFDRPTCLRHRRVVGSHYHHTYRDTSKIWGCTLDQTSQMHMKCGAQRITEMTAWVLCDKKIIPIGEVRHSLHNLHFHQLSL